MKRIFVNEAICSMNILAKIHLTHWLKLYMNIIYSILLLVLLAFNYGLAQELPIDCHAPQSQYEKNMCAFKEEEKQIRN
ncbi:hypothetical protein GXP67_00300 [Rhodocytophaga rosea]|uniref:Uncharacterized protein n=1 Tax=Rhodocytophaga rosea TaxID=2704465 RepID=A0A6C0GBN9_9BACT|nr:hypothetical protein [Rhodocytophaga rosea]QHT65222.1 hypothetical protein GXP67_00300 [Rhodocytophaga rosea]